MFKLKNIKFLNRKIEEEKEINKYNLFIDNTKLEISSYLKLFNNSENVGSLMSLLNQDNYENYKNILYNYYIDYILSNLNGLKFGFNEYKQRIKSYYSLSDFLSGKELDKGIFVANVNIEIEHLIEIKNFNKPLIEDYLNKNSDKFDKNQRNKLLSDLLNLCSSTKLTPEILDQYDDIFNG
jgi:hypothetical protein